VHRHRLRSPSLQPRVLRSLRLPAPKSPGNHLRRSPWQPESIVSTEELQNQLNEKIDTDQIDADIALSSDTSDEEGYADTYVINTDAEDEREEGDPITDVEPDDKPEKIAARERRLAKKLQVSEQPEPLILTQFQMTVAISDKLESTAEVVPSTTNADHYRQHLQHLQVLLSHHVLHQVRWTQQWGNQLVRIDRTQLFVASRRLFLNRNWYRDLPKLSSKLVALSISSLHMANATVNFLKSTD